MNLIKSEKYYYTVMISRECEQKDSDRRVECLDFFNRDIVSIVRHIGDFMTRTLSIIALLLVIFEHPENDNIHLTFFERILCLINELFKVITSEKRHTLGFTEIECSQIVNMSIHEGVLQSE